VIQSLVENWDYPALGDICDVRDGTHESPKYVEDGYPLITSKNLTDHGVSFENINYITKADYEAIEKRSAVADGDILYGMIGTVGNPVIVKKEREFSVKNVAIFKFKEESEIYNAYLFYVLGSDYITRQIAKESKGGTQKFVSLKVLRGLKIPLPPLETQKQIVAILEKSDQLRKDCKQMEQELNSLAQSVFIDMFGDPVTNPKGYRQVELNEVTDRIIDCPHSTPKWTQTGVLCIRTSNLTKGGWDFSEERYVDEQQYEERTARSKVEPGDLILSREGTVGIAAIVSNGVKLCLGQRLVQIRVDSRFLQNEFLLFQLLFQLEPHRLTKVMSGSTVKHLNMKDIRALPVITPTLKEQAKFTAIINKISSQILISQVQQYNLNNNFKALMQLAFKGELSLKSTKKVA
jgi:type I restriction enzyme S subunit